MLKKQSELDVSKKELILEADTVDKVGIGKGSIKMSNNRIPEANITLLKIGIVGAILSICQYLAFNFTYATIGLTSDTYTMFVSISTATDVLLAIGFVGFLSKHESLLAFPTMATFLAINYVDFLVIIVSWEVRFGIYIGLNVVVAIMLLVVRRKARNQILLYIFSLTLVLASFVPDLIRIAFLDNLTGSVFMVRLLEMSPYIVFNTAVFVLATFLFISEVRKGVQQHQSIDTEYNW